MDQPGDRRGVAPPPGRSDGAPAAASEPAEGGLAIELGALLLPTPDAVVLTDRDGTILLVNDQLCEIFKYREDQLVGQAIELLLPNRFRREHPAQRAAYLADPTIRPMGTCNEVRGLRSDGVEFPVEVRLRMFEASLGTLIVASMRDVSELQTLAKIQHRSSLVLEQIATARPLGDVLAAVVAVLEDSAPGLAGSILALDPQAQRLHTLAANRLSSAYCACVDALPIDADWPDATGGDFLAARTILIDQVAHPYLAALRAAALAHHLPACWLEPIRDAEGTLCGAVAAYPDRPRGPSERESTGLEMAAHLAGIAMQRERQAQQLRDKEEQLRQAQKLEAVGTLAGGIAHEFNNLLQVILGYTDCALEGLDADQQRHSDLVQVRTAAEHARTLTRQILSFSRRQPTARALVYGNVLVKSVRNLLRPLIGANIELIVDCRAGNHPLWADPEQLQQVLLNLCLNARDAMPGGGTIRVTTSDETIDEAAAARLGMARSGPVTVIAVADTGCGMTPEVRARIFEPFFTTKGVGKGTGLGLAVVYGIVKGHGGAIEVQSTPAQGTLFRLVLPVAEETDGDAQPGGPLAAPTDRLRGNERILVADDEPLVRQLLVRVLASAGYAVTAAEDGLEAVRQFQMRNGQFELAILDVSMPHDDGHAAARRIRAAAPEFPLLFLTGYDSQSTDQADRTCPGPEIPTITKPVEPRELLQTIRASLDANRSLVG